MGISKDIKKQAVAAERVATKTVDPFVASQMKDLAEAFKVQAEILKKKQEKTEKMIFPIKATCQHGELAHRRSTIEAALRKAREM